MEDFRGLRVAEGYLNREETELEEIVLATGIRHGCCYRASLKVSLPEMKGFTPSRFYPELVVIGQFGKVFYLWQE